ncbi:MAG TPA: hypothetical protein VJS20_04155, partial [Gemmatimonadales bacterium]|nr:hypothetical protein [Gemmatimonadales bacterium]
LQFPISEEDQDEFPKLRDEFSAKKGTGDLDRVLETLRPALESLKGALRRRYVEPVEWRTKDDWWNHGHSEHVSYTTWSLILKAAAEFRHQQGKDDRALEFITLGLGLADRVWVKGLGRGGHEGYRIWHTENALKALSVVLESHSLEAGQLDRMSRVLEMLEAARPDPVAALRREDLWDRSELLDLVEGRSRHGYWRGFPFYWMTARVAVADWLPVHDQNQVLRESVSRLPTWERVQAAAEPARHIRESGTVVASMMLRPNDAFFWKSVSVDAAQMTLARIAVALARHQLETGSYPAALSGLVPRFLPAIPPDPCSGSPFLYLAEADHARVYSLGPDQNDDLGRPNPDGESDEDGDLVWTVKRRK